MGQHGCTSACVGRHGRALDGMGGHGWTRAGMDRHVGTWASMGGHGCTSACMGRHGWTWACKVTGAGLHDKLHFKPVSAVVTYLLLPLQHCVQHVTLLGNSCYCCQLRGAAALGALWSTAYRCCCCACAAACGCCSWKWGVLTPSGCFCCCCCWWFCCCCC